MSRQKAPTRPRVIVSSTASLDGRITLSKPERLLTPDVDRRWKSHWPPDVPELIAQRAANIEERHHPTVFLEGSGTFVADTAGTVTGIAGGTTRQTCAATGCPSRRRSGLPWSTGAGACPGPSRATPT